MLDVLGVSDSGGTEEVYYFYPFQVEMAWAWLGVENFERVLMKGTYAILGKLNEERPEAPLTNKAFIEDIRRQFREHRDYILHTLHENPSILMNQGPLLLNMTKTVLERRRNSNKADYYIAYSVILLLAGLADEDEPENAEEYRDSINSMFKLIKPADPTFFEVRDPVATGEGAAAGAAATAAATATSPPCTVCYKPAYYLCERCVQLHRPDTPYCSVDCQTRDWPRHRAKHIVPPIEHVSRKQRKNRRRTYRNSKTRRA